MEVVSDDPASRTGDYEDKRRDYAEAGIPEYWIVDPHQARILVLGLGDDGLYRLLGQYTAGEEARSALLAGFHVSVDGLLQAGQV